jgi:hypothetical protein
VQLICPCATPEQFIATNNVIAFLKTRKNIRNWGGFTHSSLDNPSFTGYFWNKTTDAVAGYWEPDRNVLIFVDIPEHVVGELLPYFEKLRDKMDESYEAAGVPQKSFWITLEAIHILSDE